MEEKIVWVINTFGDKQDLSTPTEVIKVDNFDDLNEIICDLTEKRIRYNINTEYEKYSYEEFIREVKLNFNNLLRFANDDEISPTAFSEKLDKIWGDTLKKLNKLDKLDYDTVSNELQPSLNQVTNRIEKLDKYLEDLNSKYEHCKKTSSKILNIETYLKAILGKIVSNEAISDKNAINQPIEENLNESNGQKESEPKTNIIEEQPQHVLDISDMINDIFKNISSEAKQTKHNDEESEKLKKFIDSVLFGK